MFIFIELLLLLYILLQSTGFILAKQQGIQNVIFPQVWYRLDSAITEPQLCDTIDLPNSYTVMMVYQSLAPSTPQQLWKINRTDDRYYSISTHGLSTEQSKAYISSNHDISTPCIYTLRHSIQPDSTYQDITQLIIGGDKYDASRIQLYEVAYFPRRLSSHQALPFQTYLALRNGITLDGVSYLSPKGDTLWNAKHDKPFYHHIQGLGTDTIYGFVSTRSVSVEDSIIRVMVMDILPENHYLLMGDNDSILSWEAQEHPYVQLQREWKMRVWERDTIFACIRLQQQNGWGVFTDTILLVVLDEEGNVQQSIVPDSVTDGLLYYSVNAYDGLRFSFQTTFIHSTQRKNSRNHISTVPQTNAIDHIAITPNPTNEDFVVTMHLAEEKSITLMIQDMSGKTIHYQLLDNIQDYTYKGRIKQAGVYLIRITDRQHHVLATEKLIVTQ